LFRVSVAGIAAVAASILFLPQLKPAQAARRFNVKGSYTGTYLSQDSTISGPMKLVISSAKAFPPGSSNLLVKGKLTIGTKLKNQKCQGFYNPTAKSLSVNAPTANGYAGTFAGTLGEDSKSFNGVMSYTHFPQGDEQLLGTATISKR
jgi:hypothetical protein